MKVADNSSRSVQEKSKKLLFDSLQKKTNYYLNKPSLEDSDLYYYVKDFFREYLDIAHELSFDEIKREIDKIYIKLDVKESINNFIDKVKGVEYKDSFFDEENIKALIKEFYGVVRLLQEEERKEQSFFHKFFKSLGLVNDDVSTQNLSPQEEDKVGVIDNTKSNNVDSNAMTFEIDDSSLDDDFKDETKRFETESENKGFENDSIEEQSSIKDGIDKKNISNNQGSDLESDFESSYNNSSNNKSDFVKNDDNVNVRNKTKDILDNIQLDDDFSKDINLSSKADNNEWSETIDADLNKSDINKSDNEYDIKKKEVNDVKKKDVTSKSNTKSNVASDNNSLFEEDIYSLIARSKKTKNKNQLTQLYTEINDLYEMKSADEKEKIYPEIVSLYEKISKDDIDSSFDTPPTFEDDIYSLIESSKKIKNKNQLTQLYKEINDLYEMKSTDEKVKIYPELVSLYERISKK